jgi:CRP-like cAMP-binding protein
MTQKSFGNPAVWAHRVSDYALGSDCQSMNKIRGGARIIASAQSPAISNKSKTLDPKTPCAEHISSLPELLRELAPKFREHGAGTALVSIGACHSHVYVLEDGWACAEAILPSGSRQILSLFLPGDILGMPALAHQANGALKAPRTIVCLTDSRVAKIESDHLMTALARTPHLIHAVIYDCLNRSAILEERLISIARRSALQRTAHFFLELSARLGFSNDADSVRYAFPLSQYVVADALGLTAEHLNRVLRQLRMSGLLHVRHGWVHLLKPHSLIRISDFDAKYLNGRDDVAV